MFTHGGSRLQDGRGREPADMKITMHVVAEDSTRNFLEEGFIPVQTTEGIVTHFALPDDPKLLLARSFDILGIVPTPNQSGNASGNATNNLTTSLNMLGTNPTKNTGYADFHANQLGIMVIPLMLLRGAALEGPAAYKKQLEWVKSLYAQDPTKSGHVIKIVGNTKLYPVLTLPYADIPSAHAFASTMLQTSKALYARDGKEGKSGKDEGKEKKEKPAGKVTKKKRDLYLGKEHKKLLHSTDAAKTMYFMDEKELTALMGYIGAAAVYPPILFLTTRIFIHLALHRLGQRRR